MESVLLPLSSFLLPLVISWLLTGLLVRWAPRLWLMDLPGERKVHTRPVPRGGGLAIFAAVLTATFLVPGARSADFLALLGLGSAILLLGLVDDLRPLPWQLRLGVQAVAAGVFAFWHPDWGPGGGALAVLWVVALTNAFNMLDNMDALSGGVAAIAAAMFALALGPRSSAAAVEPYLFLTGALAGFLWFNRPPARIFMGDAGSTFLGFFLGTYPLDSGTLDPDRPGTWVVPLCVLAVPCYDMTSVVLLRLWQRRSPFHADKQHLSHRLAALGLSSPAAVGTIYVLALASGLAGLALYHASAPGAALIGLQVALWWLAVAAVEYFRHYRRKDGLSKE